MVLNYVPCCTDSVVVARSTADPDVFGHGDLYVVDVVRVPQRLEELVGKPQSQDVLDRLFAKVVVNSEYRVSWKY